MSQKNLLKLIIIISITYFIWLAIVTINEIKFGYNLLLSLKSWSIIGMAIYILFLILEIIIYISTPKKEIKEIKIVSEALKKVFCSNCKTTFTISDTGVRPLRYTCPNCGMEGVLKGRTTEGRRLKVICQNCNNEFEIFDTGEKPLIYECPNCHSKGEIHVESES